MAGPSTVVCSVVTRRGSAEEERFWHALQLHLTANSAQSGGGTSGATLYNCLVWFNQAAHGANYVDSPSIFGDPAVLRYLCTTPLPPGPGNIATIRNSPA